MGRPSPRRKKSRPLTINFMERLFQQGIAEGFEDSSMEDASDSPPLALMNEPHTELANEGPPLPLEDGTFPIQQIPTTPSPSDAQYKNQSDPTGPEDG